MKYGHLFYKKRLVIKGKECQTEIVSDVPRGTGDSEHSKASYRRKNTMYYKIAQRLFWHNIAAHINEYVQSCEQWQKQSDLMSSKVELKSMIQCDETGWSGHL